MSDQSFVLMSTEVDLYVESLKPIELDEIGSPQLVFFLFSFMFYLFQSN